MLLVCLHLQNTLLQLYQGYVNVFPNCLVTLRRTSRQNAGFRKIIKVSGLCYLYFIGSDFDELF